jgi:hypothetical protein
MTGCTVMIEHSKLVLRKFRIYISNTALHLTSHDASACLFPFVSLITVGSYTCTNNVGKERGLAHRIGQ